MKRSDVLDLEASDVETWWDGVVDGMALGLEILRDDCKVMLPRWLPYQTMLAPLAAVLAKTGTPRTAEAGARRAALQRWFWCAVFGQAYENGPNSQAAKDVTELLDWLSNGREPEVVRGFRFAPSVLRDVTPRQRSVYRGLICLMLGSDARDFHTGSPITGALMTASHIDDHHVFPAAWLDRRGGVSPRARDCILNRTLIDRTTNQMIHDRAPSEYLTQIRQTRGFPFEAVLASHTLPSEKDSPLMRDDFEAFLDWREAHLSRAIARVTGSGRDSAIEALPIEALPIQATQDESW